MNEGGRFSGSGRNEPSLDLVIEWRGSVFDLSNLVSKGASMMILSPRQVRKPREVKRLYPMEKMMLSDDTTTKDTTMMMGKGKHKLSHSALLYEQRSSFTRRTKTGPSATYSTRDYQVETLGPGAYEFIPEDQHENLKPAPKLLGISKSHKHYESNYPDTGNYPSYGASAFDKYQPTRGPESEPIPTRQKADLQIEISPGVFARLRGSEETWNAIKSGNSTHAKCFSCEMSLLCISDAEYVICPACRVVSPLMTGSYRPESQSYNVLHPHSAVTGGVGLGMQAY